LADTQDKKIKKIMKHRKLKTLSHYLDKQNENIILFNNKHQARMNELTERINRAKNRIKEN